MQTDRELLELAAKAAGFGDNKGRVIWTETPRSNGLPNGALWNGRGYMDTAELWNPLTDDADALRLAVRLGLLVYVMRDAGFTGIRLPSEHIGGKYDEVEIHVADPYAATRRAIVRAAAEIGRSMQDGKS